MQLIVFNTKDQPLQEIQNAQARQLCHNSRSIYVPEIQVLAICAVFECMDQVRIRLSVLFEKSLLFLVLSQQVETQEDHAQRQE